MCCESFWKRTVVFCITFGLSVLVADFFMPKDLPSQNSVPPVISSPVQSSIQPVNPAPANDKNCVPVDESLKYKTLKQNESPVVSRVEKETVSKSVKPEDLKKSRREKWVNELDESFYNATKNPAEVQNLIHMEKCFETQAPKK